MTDQTPEQVDSAAHAPIVKCDFCNEPVPSVRRVALDGEYERLRTPHAVMYACPSCFEKKERTRLGLDR